MKKTFYVFASLALAFLFLAAEQIAREIKWR